ISGGILTGCIKAAHPTDVNLNAHTILENISSKATAVYALRRLIADCTLEPAGIGYIIETSEEACGDMNQRGGGNFAKAIGELCGLSNATGSDVRSFCAAPVHGLIQAASLIKAGTFDRVVIVAGGTTAKLAMNSKKHIEKGLPVLEDCLGSFAVLVEKNADSGLRLRTDIVGCHKIGSGPSPQAVIQDLVAEPLYRAGLTIGEIDCYAPELQNPEITEAAGAGNVTLANLKMIAALAVMKGEILKEEMSSFIEKHAFSGWAPTQGHIPSGIPALGWFLEWAREGQLKRGLVIGKGSLFLGRMTNLFDGVSILAELAAGQTEERTGAASPAEKSPLAGVGGKHKPGKIVAGLTLPGSEGGEEELMRGAIMAMEKEPLLEVLFFGQGKPDMKAAQLEMEEYLEKGQIQGALTFHYPFPVGIATVGHTTAPGSGRDLFIATTTGTSASSRVKALVLNVIAGASTAKAWGIRDPKVGFLNLEGAAQALRLVKELMADGYAVSLASSSRGGDDFLRGNDILLGTPDVLVCDSLTGNVIVKMLGSYSSGGRIEVAGSGYGPGVGDTNKVIGIISRATSAAVTAQALLFLARMIRSDLPGIYRHERQNALKAGLAEKLKDDQKAVKQEPVEASRYKKIVQKKTVDREIEGVDVLTLDRAVDLITGAGFYCEAGMGCTGPVLMISSENEEEVRKLLKSHNYI
ncbi:MAG: glycine/sarcosine/betaine reductase complex component C subunit beta, partial [Spirochaetota bacterium]